MAATLTTTSPSHGRCFGGVGSVVEEAEEAWRLQDRDMQVPVVVKGGRNERRPCRGSRGFMDRTRGGCCALLSAMDININILRTEGTISNFPIQPMRAIPDRAAAPGADLHCGFKSQPEEI